MLLFFLGLGAMGGWARRALIKRFNRDFVLDAAGACVLLFAGAGWGFAHINTPPAGTVALWLTLLATPLAFLVVGAFTLHGESRSTAAWLGYIALATLLFVALAIAALLVFVSALPTGWSIA